MLLGCRIGEASTPGPKHSKHSEELLWTLGCCNPSGLHGKQRLVSDLNTDILTVSETHFTARSRDQFKASLRGMGSNYTSLVAGCPLEARRVGSDAGSYSGVAVLSAHPSRSLCVDWPEDLYETSRLQFCTSFLHNMWVTGAVCYGYTEGKLHVNPRERTDRILDFGLSRLLQSPGPRYYCGDWNHESSSLEVVPRLLQHGWQEVQTLAQRVTGAPVQPTCKGVSQKDFIWLSPELVQWFAGLRLDTESFPDHAVLVATFCGGSSCLERFLWPCPLPVDWREVPPLATVVEFQATDPTKQFRHLWQLRAFQAWWPQRQLHCLGDPLWIPCEPPAHALVEVILGAFHHEVRSLESQLQQAKGHFAKFAHEVDPQLVYKDVKRPMPEPVTSLVQPCEATVTELCHDDCSLILDRSVSLDCSLPVSLGGVSVSVIHADTDQVWVDSLESVPCPSKLVQPQFLGSLPALFDAFHEQWRSRWCRHDALPNSHWDQILGFAARVLPRQTIPHRVLDSTMIQTEAFRKKSYAATGLDGVSRADVLHACPNTLRSIANMFSHAEGSGDWPTQVVAGKVNSLAKTVGASSVGQFRPIVVYSMLYRIWSSVQARYLLHQADRWAAPQLYGNRPGRQAAHLWKSLLHDMEHARSHGLPMSGLMCDIEKAYNCLPRWPIVVSAMLVGTPFEVLNGWCGAMSMMRRHFKIRDNFSDGFLTSTGLAEGDALSCYGMLLLDQLLHDWIQATQPGLQVYSYVDDWSFVTYQPDRAVAQLDAALEFCSMCDLTLDLKKTFAWSLDPSVRATLRHAGIVVRHFARDLGAHLAFRKQFTNSTVKDRLGSLDEFWTSLRQSKCSYGRKTFALRAVGLPRGLYGISSAPLGKTVWVQLRRKASASLGMKKAGVNPLLLLGLVEDRCDPQLVATLLTCRDTREFASMSIWDEAVAPFALGVLDLVPTSPSRILVDRLFVLGLCPLAHGFVQDQFGVFQFLSGNFAELTLRLQWAWQHFVDAELSHRSSFRGLWNVDVSAVRHVLSGLSADKQALFRLSLTGGFFTADAQTHWTDADPVCKWCGAPDSVRHRVWECVYTLPLRQKLAPRARQCLDDLPPALSCHGWAMFPSTWKPFVRSLLQVSPRIPELACCLSATGWNHIFTDGSCYFQSQPVLRFASWSAILARPFDSSWSLDFAGTLGSGPLPGLIQTSYRAELFALAFVLHHASRVGASVVIWLDCLSVLRRFNLLTRGLGKLKLNTANADLWAWILESVDELGIERIRLEKVAAHQALSTAKCKQDVWKIWNNRKADQVAKWANLTRPEAFWEVWERHSVETATAQSLFEEVWRLHVAVADMSVKSADELTVDEQPGSRPRAPRCFVKRFDVSAWDGSLSPSFSSCYGAEMSRRVQRWWIARVCNHSNLEVQWVSLAHLYVDYQLTFGCAGPIKSGHRWLDPLQRQYLEPEKHPFHKRLKWFKRCVKLFCKVHDMQVAFETCRPDSDIVMAFVQCVSLPWDPWILAHSERWIADHATGPIVRDAKAMRSLPIARLLGVMQLEP